MGASNTNFKINQGFVLCAGRGERMRPLTDTCPKPLLRVGGQPILDRTLDYLAAYGVDQVIVNAGHLGDQIVAHVERRTSPRVIVSQEPAQDLLETAGGIIHARNFLKDEPLFVVNGDSVWLDESLPAFDRLAQGWDDDAMDILLLLQPVERVPELDGKGDYMMAKDGRLTRSLDQTGEFVFMGLRVAHPRIFDGLAPGRRSFLELFDAAEKQGRLFGAVHDSAWFHIGTPHDLSIADRLLGALSVRMMME